MTLEELDKELSEIDNQREQLEIKEHNAIEQYLIDNNLKGDVFYKISKGQLGRLVWESHGKTLLTFVPYTNSKKLSKQNHIRIFNPIHEFKNGWVTPCEEREIKTW